MDLILGVGATILAFFFGAVVVTKLVDVLAPRIKIAWKWLASHLAFLLVLLAAYYIYMGNYKQENQYYVKPTKVVFNK